MPKLIYGFAHACNIRLYLKAQRLQLNEQKGQNQRVLPEHPHPLVLLHLLQSDHSTVGSAMMMKSACQPRITTMQVGNQALAM